MAETPAPTLRRAEIDDADAVADVWLRSYAAALPTVPAVHTEAEVHGWMREVVIARPDSVFGRFR